MSNETITDALALADSLDQIAGAMYGGYTKRALPHDVRNTLHRAAVRLRGEAAQGEQPVVVASDARDRVMGELEQWFDTQGVDVGSAADSVIAALSAAPAALNEPFGNSEQLPAPVAGDAAAETPVAPESEAIAKGVKYSVEQGEGFWKPCSGCYETEDGHPVGSYSYSAIFDCTLGGGCSECGGLGAVWDNTDYEAFAEEMQAALAQDRAPQAGAAGVPSLRWLEDNHTAWIEDDSDTPYLVWLRNALIEYAPTQAAEREVQ